MKLNCDQVLKTPKGEPMLLPSQVEGGPPEVATLGGVATRACLTTLPSDANLPYLQKGAIGGLGERLDGGGTIEISAAEIETIRTRVSTIFPPLVVNRIIELTMPSANADSGGNSPPPPPPPDADGGGD